MSSTTDATQRFNGASKKFGSSMIANLSIITALIADSAVTAVKLASDAVTTVKILDLNVTTAKIANLAVTTAKIAANAITRAELGTGSLESVIHTSEDNLVFGNTVFLGMSGAPGAAAEAGTEAVAPRAGTAKRLVVRPRVNTLDAITAATFRINGVDTLMTVNIPAASTVIVVDTQDIAIAANDLLSIDATVAGAAGAADISATLEIAYDNA